MTEYKSDIKQVAAPDAAVFERLSNLENLRSFLENVPEDKIPADKREQIKQMELTEDTMSLPGGPTGKVTLRITERKPYSLIVMMPDASPINIAIELRIGSEGDGASTIQVVAVADIPMMLRAMVKGMFNQMVQQVADMLAVIPYTSAPEGADE